MKQFTPDKVPADMFTTSKLKKMGLTPISEYSAYITYPPSKRRYKLYKLENVRPIDKNAGYSLLVKVSKYSSGEILSPQEMEKKLREISNRFKPI
ncbi:hypothetical protein QFZ77_007588 [Paenibacillus sp. V4I3]|uniref:hypothetical protein n=1 Tax=unclassified Paenibacillus TaxID=185978 RepID=UPI002786B970|nr:MULTISPECIES: hypothetical protein [unclassified Paenibacillus]MDQ0878929.1 hypothetical protein [Paenibacillus sp. V4I3]MDQ0885345.1 hypothetical protein [Paenibacillus sp. V4I9]